MLMGRNIYVFVGGFHSCGSFYQASDCSKVNATECSGSHYLMLLASGTYTNDEIESIIIRLALSIFTCDTLLLLFFFQKTTRERHRSHSITTTILRLMLISYF